MKCERCCRREEATYRVRSDVIDMKVCGSCANEATRLGIAVEVLVGGGRKGNGEKSELELRDYRSELLPLRLKESHCHFFFSADHSVSQRLTSPLAIAHARDAQIISWRHQHMNEMLLIFSVGVVAGIVLGILMVHE